MRSHMRTHPITTKSRSFAMAEAVRRTCSRAARVILVKNGLAFLGERQRNRPIMGFLQPCTT
jgi:hypothetical protein